MVLEPGGIIAWIVVGLIAGWLTGKVIRGGGYGVLRRGPEAGHRADLPRRATAVGNAVHAHLRRAGSDAAAEQDPEWPGTSLDGCKQHEAMEWAFVVAECHTQGTYRATDTPRRRRRQPAW